MVSSFSKYFLSVKKKTLLKNGFFFFQNIFKVSKRRHVYQNERFMKCCDRMFFVILVPRCVLVISQLKNQNCLIVNDEMQRTLGSLKLVEFGFRVVR